MKGMVADSRPSTLRESSNRHRMLTDGQELTHREQKKEIQIEIRGKPSKRSSQVLLLG